MNDDDGVRVLRCNSKDEVVTAMPGSEIASVSIVAIDSEIALS